MPETILTMRQRAILATIEHYIATVGYPPTHREIGDAVGLASSASVSYQLCRLEEAGCIRRTRAGVRNGPRALQLTRPAA